jgi:TatD DNase family protein
MLIDTHCHINTIVKKEFDIPLSQSMIHAAQPIIAQAESKGVTTIINVGTSLIESTNCIQLAQEYASCFATIGIHPNDCTEDWRSDLQQIAAYAQKSAQLKVVAIGECGLDFHYPDFNLQRQKDAFKMQIELALEHDLALIVHTRDAGDETLRMLEEFKGQIKRGIIHCFSENQSFANTSIEWGYALGIGGTITYPKNDYLRTIVKNIPLTHLVLETDAPFLPPQYMRGKQNTPDQIAFIAQFIADLRDVPFEDIARATTNNAQAIFKL